jgi:hypothetical protein
MHRQLPHLLIALLITLPACLLVTLSRPVPAAPAEPDVKPPATAPAPPAPATQPAAITGTLKTAETVTRIAAVDRPFADVLKTSLAVPKDPFLYDGTFNAKTGAFAIPKLLPGRTYDLIIWTENAAHEKTRWEGASMDYHRPILPAPSEQPFTPEDQKWIEDFVKEMPAFYDKARILHLAADHKHAVALVELARTREFHSQERGEIIYRVELWYFENLFGGWAKDKNTEKVLARARAPADKLEKNWQFLPELGGIAIDASGKSPALALTLPETPSEKNGLAGKIP